MAYNRLLFRRQYVLGARFVEREGWLQLHLGKQLCLTYHPDLLVTQKQNPRVQLTLLGYLADSEHPEWSDTQILTDLAKAKTHLEDILKKTYRLGGRWILIIVYPDAAYILHDAIGLRDIYYTRQADGVWCGSQPHLLASHLDMPLSQDRDIRAFFAPEHLRSRCLMWSGNRTTYDGIFHLLPNHLLNLSTGAVTRYGIDLPERTLPIQVAIRENCRILSNLMQAIHHRFKPIIACTAGSDSRVILAASRRVAPQSEFYACQYANITSSHPDIAVPSQMLYEQGVPFTVQPAVREPDAQFEEAVEQNTFIMKSWTVPVTYMLYKRFSDRLSVSENSLPLFKVFFPRLTDPSGYKLARMVHQHRFPFIVECLDAWLASAKDYLDDPRLQISDHYFWEFLMGNWAATAATLQDVAVEECSPTNCRQFILNFYSVDPRYHTEKHTYDFHHKMIKQMWPELLDYPINPTRKACFYRTLRHYGMFHRLQHWKNLLLNR